MGRGDSSLKEEDKVTAWQVSHCPVRASGLGEGTEGSVFLESP